MEEDREARKVRIQDANWIRETKAPNACFTDMTEMLFEAQRIPRELLTAAKRGGFTYTTNQAPTTNVTYTTSTAHT